MNFERSEQSSESLWFLDLGQLSLLASAHADKNLLVGRVQGRTCVPNDINDKCVLASRHSVTARQQILVEVPCLRLPCVGYDAALLVNEDHRESTWLEAIVFSLRHILAQSIAHLVDCHREERLVFSKLKLVKGCLFIGVRRIIVKQMLRNSEGNCGLNVIVHVIVIRNEENAIVGVGQAELLFECGCPVGRVFVGPGTSPFARAPRISHFQEVDLSSIGVSNFVRRNDSVCVAFRDTIDLVGVLAGD